MKFKATIEYWKPERKAGLAVVYVPARYIDKVGGLKQRRVKGRMNAAAFVSSVWPAGLGRLALNVSKAMMSAAKVSVGDQAGIEIDDEPA